MLNTNKCFNMFRCLLPILFSLYTCSQEQSGVVVDLLRLLLHLKSVLTAVVENAQAVAHNLPDHNHNAQDARSAFAQVSIFRISH